MIEHESYLYSNQPPVGNLKPLIHKRYYHARYNTVSEVSFSHQYVLGMSSRKIKKQDQILTCQFEYDVHHLLTRLKNKFSATSTFNWSERYRYTRLGQLQSWSRHGDMVFFDEYGNKMSGQKFVMDKMGNMQKLTAEIEGVSNESTYSYTNNFRLLRIDNKNAWAKLMVPKMINFTYSAEGQLITKRYTIGFQGAPTTATFTLVATRKAGGPQATDRCGDFTLTNTGIRNIVNYAAGTTATECWNK